jgi:hypothetical protein
MKSDAPTTWPGPWAYTMARGRSAYRMPGGVFLGPGGKDGGGRPGSVPRHTHRLFQAAAVSGDIRPITNEPRAQARADFASWNDAVFVAVESTDQRGLAIPAILGSRAGDVASRPASAGGRRATVGDSAGYRPDRQVISTASYIWVFEYVEALLTSASAHRASGGALLRRTLTHWRNRLHLKRIAAVMAVASTVLLLAANPANAAQAFWEGTVDSGGLAKIFSTERVSTTGAVQNTVNKTADAGIALIACDNLQVVSGEWYMPLGVQRNFGGPGLRGNVCFRQQIRRWVAKDTNGSLPGNGVTTMKGSIYW